MTKDVLISGSSNKLLAQAISKKADIHLCEVELEEFANREIRLRVIGNVKGKCVYILQSTNYPAERNIIELCLIADAAKRSGAEKIIAIIPWLGYSPQDKVFREGEALSSEVIVRILESAPIDEFVTVDVHSQLVLGMFKKPIKHLSAMDVFIKHFKSKLDDSWCSVALDNGALDRADLFAKALNLKISKFDKTRDRKTGEVTFHKLEGDVRGKNVITFDDYVSTGGTTVKSCEFLKKQGAKRCIYCITHFIVPETFKKVKNSPIDQMVITDSINWDDVDIPGNMKVISIDALLTKFVVDRG